MADKTDLEAKGFYKLSLLQRIGYGAGDMAQNFVFQAASFLIPFYYSDVYIFGGDKNKSTALSGILLLVVRFIDVVWDPIVGAFVDKHHPRWGKYRSYLILGGMPLCILYILCFIKVGNGNIPYACITYTLLQMCYTLTNVPYGALNASMTRDTDEIAKLTTIRMTMANIAGFFVYTCAPIVISLFAGGELPIGMILFNLVGNIPGILFMPFIPLVHKAIGKKTVFYVGGIIGIIGFALIYIFSKIGAADNDHAITMIIANFVKSTGMCVCTGYMWVLVPEVISYAEYTTGRRIAGIVNALTGLFFKAGFAIGGVIPSWILAATGYVAGEASPSTLNKEPSAWIKFVLLYGFVGFLLFIYCFTQTKEKVVMDEKEAENVKVSDLWVEFIRNGPLRVIAFYFITGFCAMNTTNTAVGYFYGMQGQKASAVEGSRWAIAVVPGILFAVMIGIIAMYSLTDDKIEEINKEIEKRNHKTDDAELA
jgi:Na+/melibiose symporter and related transporters